MLAINEIKTGRVLNINGEPYIVVKTDHHKMGRGGAILKTKLKNLISNTVLDRTFQGNEKAEEAQTEKRKADYLYKDENEAYFMDTENYEQFNLPLDQLGDKVLFMKDGIVVNVLYFNDKPVSIELPVKVELKVVSAPPGVKGNTASNVNKTIELETGAQISAPLFVNTGDIIRVNTDTGEYVERA